jgi:hypothetical protein
LESRTRTKGSERVSLILGTDSNSLDGADKGPSKKNDKGWISERERAGDLLKSRMTTDDGTTDPAATPANRRYASLERAG